MYAVVLGACGSLQEYFFLFQCHINEYIFNGLFEWPYLSYLWSNFYIFVTIALSEIANFDTQEYEVLLKFIQMQQKLMGM